MAPGIPERLSIPALDVDAPLVPLARTPDNGMGAPADADTAGWDAPGPVPGSPGNALVAAHRDLGGRLGSFWRLETLRPGDAVVVTLSGGRRVEYAVTRVETYPTDRAPLADIFAPSRERRLTLITCGGTFDRSQGDYLQRVVVRAEVRRATSSPIVFGLE